MLNSVASQDPIKLFRAWFEDAGERIPENPDAVALASVDARGFPSVRMVLLKDFGPDGFVFYTNYNSRKAREIDAHPAVALTWYWRGIERQIRVEGRAERVDAATSDAYFATRSRLSQLGAWASLQSQPLPTPDALAVRMAKYEEMFRDQDVRRPEHWGGYRVIPARIEFWEGAAYRLHERWVFTREAPGTPWETEQIFP